MVGAMQETCIYFTELDSEDLRLDNLHGIHKGGSRNGSPVHPTPCGPLEASAGSPVNTWKGYSHTSVTGLCPCQAPSLHRGCSVAPLCAGLCVVCVQCGNVFSSQRAAEGLAAHGWACPPTRPVQQQQRSQSRESRREGTRVPLITSPCKQPRCPAERSGSGQTSFASGCFVPGNSHLLRTCLSQV